MAGEPWDRQKGERNLWYDRFHRYLMMGPGRSVLAVYNEERERRGLTGAKSIPGRWNKAIARWEWRARAQAHDQAEREKERVEYEAERKKQREQRRTVLKDYFAIVAKAVQKLQEKSQKKDGAVSYKPHELTQAMRMVVQELRAEYDDLPQQRYLHGGIEDGAPISVEDGTLRAILTSPEGLKALEILDKIVSGEAVEGE